MRLPVCAVAVTLCPDRLLLLRVTLSFAVAIILPAEAVKLAPSVERLPSFAVTVTPFLPVNRLALPRVTSLAAVTATLPLAAVAVALAAFTLPVVALLQHLYHH